MYEAIFRALGAPGYGQRFLHIARCLPWREGQRLLADCGQTGQLIVADSLLFSVSGMLQPALDASHTMDDETRIYLSTLRRAWRRLPCEVQRLSGQCINWRHPHVRPMNTPERRLAGMAQLLAQYSDMDLHRVAVSLCRAARGRTQTSQAQSLNRALIDMLQTPPHTYWGGRSRFGSRPQHLQQRLIGRQRALTIVVDAMLPVLLCDAHARGDTELEQLLLTGYRVAPRLPGNRILRDMSRRLLGDDPRLLALVTHARHQQGMLQVFEDYCSHDEGDCQGCDFPQL